jgi:hypothetical protein
MVPRVGDGLYGRGIVTTHYKSTGDIFSNSLQGDYKVVFGRANELSEVGPDGRYIMDQNVLHRMVRDITIGLNGYYSVGYHDTSSADGYHVHLLNTPNLAGFKNLHQVRVASEFNVYADANIGILRSNPIKGVYQSSRLILFEHPQPLHEFSNVVPMGLDMYAQSFMKLLHNGGSVDVKFSLFNVDKVGVEHGPYQAIATSNRGIKLILYNMIYGSEVFRIFDDAWWSRHPYLHREVDYILDPPDAFIKPTEVRSVINSQFIKTNNGTIQFGNQWELDKNENLDLMYRTKDFKALNVYADQQKTGTIYDKHVVGEFGLSGTFSLSVQHDAKDRTLNCGWGWFGVLSGLSSPLTVMNHDIKSKYRVIPPSWEPSRDEVMVLTSMYMDMTGSKSNGNAMIVHSDDSNSYSDRFGDVISNILSKMGTVNRFDIYGGTFNSLHPINKVGPQSLYQSMLFFGGNIGTSPSKFMEGSGDAVNLYYAINGLRAGCNGLMVLPGSYATMPNTLSMIFSSFAAVVACRLNDSWVCVYGIGRLLNSCPVPHPNAFLPSRENAIRMILEECFSLTSLSTGRDGKPVLVESRMNTGGIRTYGPGNLSRSSAFSNALIAEFLLNKASHMRPNQYTLPHSERVNVWKTIQFQEIGAGNRPLTCSSYYGYTYSAFDINVLNSRYKKSDDIVSVGRFVPVEPGTYSKALIISPRRLAGVVKSVNNGIRHEWRDGVPIKGAHSSSIAIKDDGKYLLPSDYSTLFGSDDLKTVLVHYEH